MNRKYGLLLLGGILAGSLLAGAGWLLTGAGDRAQSGSLPLEPFRNISLRVMSGDVTIQEGEAYGITYRLHGREKVVRSEVVGDTLHFDTGFSPLWKPGRGSWSVVITVPGGTSFGSLDLQSTAGDIGVSGYAFQQGSFATTAGEISLSDLTCEELSARTVSHSISLTDSRVSGAAALETTAGQIRVESPFGSVRANSIGGVTYNGTQQGSSFEMEEDAPVLTAGSVSGRIVLDIQ